MSLNVNRWRESGVHHALTMLGGGFAASEGSVCKGVP